MDELGGGAGSGMSEVAGVDQRDSQPSSRAVVGDPAAADARSSLSTPRTAPP